jgi:hypothetical protein
LSEEASGRGNTDLYRDATANAFHGTDNISAVGRNGVIGYGHEFDTMTVDWIDLGAQRLFGNSTSTVTLEGWVRLKPSHFSGTIVTHSIAGSQPTSMSRAFLAFDSEGYIGIGGRTIDSVDATVPYMDHTPLNMAVDQWYHVVGVIKYGSDSMYTYVDGELWNAVELLFHNETTPGTNSALSAIGAQDNGTSPAHCYLDEIRTQRSARSPAWIKLCYESQRPDQKVTVLK